MTSHTHEVIDKNKKNGRWTQAHTSIQTVGKGILRGWGMDERRNEWCKCNWRDGNWGNGSWMKRRWMDWICEWIWKDRNKSETHVHSGRGRGKRGKEKLRRIEPTHISKSQKGSLWIWGGNLLLPWRFVLYNNQKSSIPEVTHHFLHLLSLPLGCLPRHLNLL